jgi:hypothetical protein
MANEDTVDRFLDRLRENQRAWIEDDEEWIEEAGAYAPVRAIDGEWTMGTLVDALNETLAEEKAPASAVPEVSEAMIDEAVDAYQVNDNGKPFGVTFYTYKRNLMRAALVAAFGKDGGK